LHNMKRIDFYIHQKADWPQFKWEAEEIVHLLSEARKLDVGLLRKANYSIV